ncbi:PstS family phosphate ABC transporter substrate-binding protein [Clostridium sp. SYSU_GA19001]|uniref:PstS family phosphate ABC transporter substrate-binding protein n=1 Tax=Clostridium caldaquaticum TaxID=2940653 RepID=UPI00207738B6|nr:PstS family phosphate ABC transporter substrate-binding protein [Clostridium caldaquaticum]MCM8711555.1 PstS family phosphate ABC transporter substrate-binding protein [Clostridium caldaquaticum]
MTKRRLLGLISSILVTATVFSGCASKQPAENKEQAPTAKLSGEIKIDGSSTVLPISESVAEEFKAKNPDVKITVGESGTGGGMKKFINKEIDIADASRPIKAEEKDAAAKNGVEFIELKVALDGITVVVNKDNTWAKDMTVEELNSIWKEGSTVKTWKDVRADWPAEQIKLYAPGTASGTFEFFTEAINKKAKSARATDVTTSEDDGVLVQGVAGDKNGMSYFGYSYYEANKSKLNAVNIAGVAPSFDTIKDGTYKPLSRPLYIYVNKEALKKAEVKEFVNFYLNNAKNLVSEAGYVALPEADYTKQLDLVK